ncbi:threonine-phosphate decarboxylase CobD [Alkaliphilus sp. B6464]|uniref:threonine-phosphate decarboxylase CobD n=1 Tax=Alkaliphilus sp. B6464 TaxID=2731219 RepID=UPI001BA649D5|nr:threonine-phosphate decarboxylase CobD [Alkaliphilus sp. B6464]QUH19991.1 threonine-phosphate decarboxylase [Alkaliphilus sp. B6464]
MNKHGGYFGHKQREVIDFSVNINPLGVPSKLMKELEKELPMLIRYPEIDGKTAKETLSKYLDKEADKIILGNGATELIYLFARAIKASKVLLIQPTFTEYERAFQVSGSSIFHFYTHEKAGFRIDMPELLASIENLNPQVVVLCNPNNPTGVFYEPEELMPLLEVIKKKNCYLFVDESFIDFTEKISLSSFVEEYPIFILRSMTKTYGIPGLRLGYGLGDTDIIKELNYIKEPWTINSLALKAVDILLMDNDYFNRTQKWYEEEKNFLLNGLSSINNIDVFPSEGNFFLCKLKNSSGENVKSTLLNYGIYIRTCTDFKGLNDQFIRLAVRGREENEKLIHSLYNLI